MSAPGHPASASLDPEAGAGGAGSVLVLRFSGEVSTKARPTRRHFVNLLLRNLKDALASVGSDASVTGEAIGQVSSQTLTNLAAIPDVTRLPVLRPLLGFDEDEIILATERMRREGFDCFHFRGGSAALWRRLEQD